MASGKELLEGLDRMHGDQSAVGVQGDGVTDDVRASGYAPLQRD